MEGGQKGEATEEKGGRQGGGTHRKAPETMMEGRVHHSCAMEKVQAKSFRTSSEWVQTVETRRSFDCVVRTMRERLRSG